MLTGPRLQEFVRAMSKRGKSRVFWKTNHRIKKKGHSGRKGRATVGQGNSSQGAMVGAGGQRSSHGKLIQKGALEAFQIPRNPTGLAGSPTKTGEKGKEFQNTKDGKKPAGMGNSY